MRFTLYIQAESKVTAGEFAALKQIEIKDDEELEELMVEVDILTECQHNNIVGIKEAFFFEQKLWVGVNCNLTQSFPSRKLVD